jgi:hypothetical protein
MTSQKEQDLDALLDGRLIIRRFRLDETHGSH